MAGIVRRQLSGGLDEDRIETTACFGGGVGCLCVDRANHSLLGFIRCLSDREQKRVGGVAMVIVLVSNPAFMQR